MRNLHLEKKENLETKKGSSNNLGEYVNLTEEESQRMYDLKRVQ